MMPQIRYDFSDLEDACYAVIMKQNNQTLGELKRALNRFFVDSTCLEIIYTKNDSLFFGASVYPVTDKELVTAILQDDKKCRFTKYSIELDSKLFNPILDLKPGELLAIILHEVGHIVNDPTPVEQVRDAISVGLAKKGDSLNIPKSVQYYQIIAFGIKNTVRKMNSMFFIYKDGEVLADEFVHACGYGEELNSAFDKIIKSGMKVNDNVNKLTALTWTLTLYKDVKVKRIPAIRLIKKMRPITGSELEKRELDILERAVSTADDMTIEEACYDFEDRDCYYITEDTTGQDRKTKFAYMRKQATIKSIKTFESDVYEYAMRIKHISTEEDALYLMRQINMRISVLEDFLERERLSESERKKWWALLDKYYSLRDKMTTDVHYRYDYSGSVIQVNYPDIVENRMR